MLPKHSGSGLEIGECLWHWPQLAGCGPRVVQVAQLNNSLTAITLLVANLRFFSFSMHLTPIPIAMARLCQENAEGGGGGTCYDCQIEAFLLGHNHHSHHHQQHHHGNWSCLHIISLLRVAPLWAQGQTSAISNHALQVLVLVLTQNNHLNSFVMMSEMIMLMIMAMVMMELMLS